MREIASRSQLRMAFVRWALLCVPVILLLGIGSGMLAGSGYRNRWFVALDKPDFTPPGWMFAGAWTVLYILMGLSLAIMIGARGARGRGVAITLFIVQLLLNLGWSPLFFRGHEVTLAFYLLLVILLLAGVTTVLFARIRPVAALLLLPYLAWLCFASYLSFTIDRMNPEGETLVAPRYSTQI